MTKKNDSNFIKEFEIKFGPYDNENKDTLLFYAYADGFDNINEWIDWKKAHWILTETSRQKIKEE